MNETSVFIENNIKQDYIEQKPRNRKCILVTFNNKEAV